MADILLGFEGSGVQSVTMKLDDTTKTALGTDYASAKGKCVTVTANDTVGFGGATGSPLFGIILFADARGLATVQYKGFKENVPTKKIGTTPAFPALLEFGLGCDDAGNMVKLTAGKLGVITAIATSSGDTTTSTIVL